VLEPISLYHTTLSDVVEGMLVLHSMCYGMILYCSGLVKGMQKCVLLYTVKVIWLISVIVGLKFLLCGTYALIRIQGVNFSHPVQVILLLSDNKCRLFDACCTSIYMHNELEIVTRGLSH